MKVFLSWSGSVSKQVALALREWLPNVIQAVDPWMSAEDIDKGARWSSEVAEELKSTKAGIVCVTPDNHGAPWLNFEAGAVSKSVGKEMVIPYLFRMRPADVTGPLVQFQMADSTKDDTKRLVFTLNKALESKPLTETKLGDAFEKWWGQLEEKFHAIVTLPAILAADPKRSLEDMVEELLSIGREQSKTIQYLQYSIKHLVQADAFKGLYGTATLIPTSRPSASSVPVDPLSNLRALMSEFSGKAEGGDDDNIEIDPAGEIHDPNPTTVPRGPRRPPENS